MTVPDLHPEELLLQGARRGLSPDERADLEAHLARCPACALEVRLRGDLARALRPSDADYALATRALARAVASSLGSRPEPEETPRRRERSLSSSWPRQWGRMALLGMLTAGTTVAATTAALQLHDHRIAEASRRVAPAVPAAPAKEAKPGRPSPPLDRGGETVASAATAPAAAPAAPIAAPAGRFIRPAARAPEPPARQPGPSPVSARAATPSSRPPTRSLAAARPVDRAPREVPPAPPSESPPPPVPAEGASSLFARAETARAAGSAALARDLYGQLATRFPGSREERASRVLLGQLLLDRLADPQRALAAFDGYLRDEPAGTLAEEAQVGRALSLGALGRAGEERAAWQELLSRHPYTIHAEAARARLAALGPAR